MLEVHKKYDLPCLPSDNPYLNDGWRPSDTEWTASCTAHVCALGNAWN